MEEVEEEGHPPETKKGGTMWKGGKKGTAWTGVLRTSQKLLYRCQESSSIVSDPTYIFQGKEEVEGRGEGVGGRVRGRAWPQWTPRGWPFFRGSPFFCLN